VLVVAVLALQNRQNRGTVAGTDTRIITVTPSVGSSTGASSGSSAASGSAAGTGTGSASGPTTSLEPQVGAFPLTVLNNDYANRPELAAQAAEQFHAAGWTVSSTDEHYVNDIVSSVAYYDPAVKGTRRAALALQKQFPAIKRVAPRFAELPAGPVVVALTSDYPTP
jgi:LytR cell envelope-related transcriptional attenuator